MKNNLKFTIITVCFNAEDSISDTMRSVLMQTYKNIDYLFIDALSNDSTLKIIEEYSVKDSRIRFISEKDFGIYDAMNKGIVNSLGDVLFFLNSGDEFYDNNVISDIACQFEKNNIDILYGDIVRKSKKDIFLDKQCEINLNYLLLGKMICHQSIFAKKSTFDLIGNFSLDYKINSDYEWFIRANLKGVNICYYPRTISYYDIEGLSSQKKSRKIIWKEREKIIYKNFGLIRYLVLFFNQRFTRRIRIKFKNIWQGMK